MQTIYSQGEDLSEGWPVRSSISSRIEFERHQEGLRPLMKRMQDGDRMAAREFLAQAAKYVDSWYAIALNAAERGELVEAVICSCFEKRSTCNPAHPVRPWIRAIAEYKCRSLGLGIASTSRNAAALMRCKDDKSSRSTDFLPERVSQRQTFHE